MSFTSEYLKKRDELKNTAPKFTLPTTASGIVQKATTYSPAPVIKTEAGASAKKETPAVDLPELDTSVLESTGRTLKTNVPNTLNKVSSTYQPKGTSNPITTPILNAVNRVKSALPEVPKFTLPTTASGLLNPPEVEKPDTSELRRKLAFNRRARIDPVTIRKMEKEVNKARKQDIVSTKNGWDDFAKGVRYGTEKIAAGLLGAGESVSDLIGSGFWGAVQGVSSLGGLAPNAVSEYAGRAANSFLDNSITDRYNQSIEERYSPSDAMKFAGSINETVANMLPSVGAGILTGGASTLGSASKLLPTGSNLGRTIMGLQAAGSGAQEAKQSGATLGQALTYGAASGALETVIESLTGGIPGLGKGAASELVSKVVSNPAVRKVADIVGEGGEEALSTIITPYIKRAIYDSDAETATADEIAQSAVMGMLAAGVLQAGIELPSYLDARAQVTRQANANLSDPEFVRSTTDSAIQEINRNLNRQTLPMVEAVPMAETAQTLPTVQSAPAAANVWEVSTPPVNTESAAQRRQGVQIPVETRTWTDAGNRKVNAFQYDHPELRPYYAEAARALQYDLSAAVKGERYATKDAEGYITGYTGVKRQVTEPIAQALDNAGLSYKQIEKALDDLIADNGQENHAAAKKVELVLDDMLTNGYTDADGYDVAPNQDYIAARERANTGAGSEYNMSEAEWASLMASEPESTGSFLPMVNGPESSVGAARKGFDSWSEFQGTKSQFFPEGANAARPVDVPTTDPQGRNVRKTASTAMGAKAIPDEVVGDIANMVMAGDLSYDVATDKAAIDRAVSKLSQEGGFQRGMEEFTSAVQKGVVSKDLAALGQQLLVNAANAGDANATAELLSMYAQMETTAGQAVQAASILRKLSPTAQLYAAQKAVDNLQKTLGKQLKGTDIKIDTDLIDEFNRQTDQAGRDAVLDKIYQNIADQVPSTWKDKWNAWRYLAMLGNPRTHVRNFFGNVGFQPVRFTKDRIAALIEAGVSGVSGGKLQRTKSFATSPELYAAAWQDYDNVADVLSGNKYDDVQSIINDNRTIFKFKPLEAARRGNSNLLSAEDVVFKRITYAGALSGYLNANGVNAEQLKSGSVDPQLLSAARDYAGQEALKATYNDRNAVSDRVVKVANSLGTFGEAVLPFKRTPANILVRGFEYSPLGLAKGLTYDLAKVKAGEMTGAQAIDHIAAGLTGSGLMALGALLAASGVVTGGAGDDEKQAEWNELTGGQTYALNLPGGGSVTLDWLAPEALPFFMGVQAMQSFGENGLTGDTISSAFASISEPMLEMSMLQSLNDLIDNVSYSASNEKLQGLVGSALISYLTQAIPTIGGQIERSGEDKRYSTYTDKDSLLPTDVQYAIGKAAAKLPGVDYQQIPYIDAWGREEETGTLPMRVLNNFLNPAYTSSLNVTPVDEEIQRLYNETGIGSVVPSRADKTIKVNGEDVNLSGEEYVTYAKTKGQTAYDLLESIIQTDAYGKLSDQEKADVVADVYQYANDVGKAAVSSYKPDEFTKKIQDTGVDPASYILYMATADADDNSSVTQGESAAALLPMKDLTTEEKGKVWQSQNSSWSTEKNPFTGALSKAGINASTATKILSGYSEINSGDGDARAKQTELSKLLDGLNLTEDQRAVADDTFKFYSMFPAKVNAYSIETMSDAAQRKWPKAQAAGMDEDTYLKFYPICTSDGKKAEIIQKLQAAGMSEGQAYAFWDIVKKN